MTLYENIEAIELEIRMRAFFTADLVTPLASAIICKVSFIITLILGPLLLVCFLVKLY